MARYSIEFKKSIVRKCLLPESPGVYRTAEETGISVQTLYSWIRQLREDAELGTEQGGERSILEKQELLLEASSHTPDSLGEWMRERGVHEEDLKLWRKEVRNALKRNDIQIKRELAAEKKKVKSLEKELRRKEAALAEVTAIMVMKKKLEKYFGEDAAP